MVNKKSNLKLILHTKGGQKKVKAIRYLLFLFLFGAVIYSTANSFIELPISIPIALLTIITGLLLIMVTFLGVFRKNDADGFRFFPVSNFMYPFFNWVISIVCITMGYSSLYTEIFRRSAESFVGVLGGISSVYFSVVTFATVGYGDIYPGSAIARILVVSEILIPVCILPVILATSISWVINKNQLLNKDSEMKHSNPFTRIK